VSKESNGPRRFIEENPVGIGTTNRRKRRRIRRTGRLATVSISRIQITLSLGRDRLGNVDSSSAFFDKRNALLVKLGRWPIRGLGATNIEIGLQEDNFGGGISCREAIPNQPNRLRRVVADFRANGG